MGWVADLLKEIPSAARYKSDLEKLASDHEVLKSENVALKDENTTLKSELHAAKEEIRNLEEQQVKAASAKSNEQGRKRAKSYSVQ